MKKKLDMLEELQTIDQSVDEKKSEQSVHQACIVELEQAFSVLQSTLTERQAQIAVLQREKAELEASLHTEQENIRRSETNMKEIRTNKEYQAVGREIAAARKQVTDIEDQLLQLVTRMDELQAEATTLQEELSACVVATARDINEKQAAINELQLVVDTATTHRDAIIKGLGSNLVRRYSQLREQRRGQALAEARDGSCMGCNMQIPPQMYNSLFRGDEMYFCPHCQRILILKQEKPTES